MAEELFHDLFGGASPMPHPMRGKQWQSLPMPRRAPNLPAGHTVSITTPADHIAKMKASGAYTPALKRQSIENEMFGIPTETPAEKRPVYGYLRSNDNPKPLPAYAFGEENAVNLNVHPRALRGATTTPMDSFKGGPVEQLGPDHKPAEYPAGFAGPRLMNEFREVQLHNGLPFKDIESADVVTAIHPDDTPEQIAEKKAQGEKRANVARQSGLPVTHSTRFYQPSLFEGMGADQPDQRWSGEWRRGETLSSGTQRTDQ